VGDHFALAEPVNGSAHEIAGQGIANPLAAILAAAQLLDGLGEAQGAAVIRAAVKQTLTTGPQTPDLGGQATTMQVAEAVAACVKGKIEES
jgi:homoisocitrate dehydrogenase